MRWPTVLLDLPVATSQSFQARTWVLVTSQGMRPWLEIQSNQRLVAVV